MRLTRQAALAMALVSGLLAALFAWYYMNQQRPGKVKEPEEISIPVPVRTIPPQVDLQPDMFRLIKVPKEQAPAGVLSTVASAQGRVSLTELVKDQPVKLNQIAVRSKSLGLAYAVPEGLRGMTLMLDIEGTAGDFVKPGNRVDLVAAFQSEGHLVVRTVVQDVQVLAVGTATSIELPREGEGGGNEPAPSRRQETPVTLAVTPNQAQEILISDLAGNVRLLLRAMGDRSVTTLPSANSWTLIGKVPTKDNGSGGHNGGGAAPATTVSPSIGPPAMYPGAHSWGAAPAAPPTAAPATPKRPSVEVIRGGQREVVTPD
jgi:pilus assembly protein CpaB